MTKTGVIKNGNSQAVRIQSELQYKRLDIEYEIERSADLITIRPASRPLNGLMDKFRAYNSDIAADGREQPVENDRGSL